MDKKVFFSWEIEPFSNYDRTADWYWILWSISLFIVLICFYIKSYVILTLILIFSSYFTYFTFQKISPKKVLIFEDGITIDNKFYEYDIFEKFYIYGLLEEINFSPRLILIFKEKNKINLSLSFQKETLDDLENLNSFLIKKINQEYVKPSLFDILLERFKL